MKQSILLNLLIALLLLPQLDLRAQHHPEHHQQPAADTVPAEMPAMAHSQHEQMDGGGMFSAYSLSLPMTRNGSGTGWLPDNTPMYGYMTHTPGGWNLMFHGNLFLRYNMQNLNNDYRRGEKRFDAPNWFMGMATRQVGTNGLLAFNAMLSLDRLIMPGDGYPLLLQTGETWDDKPLIDRQHPHDLVSNLAIAYTQRLSPDVDITGYFGFPGEPALGPVAFMHRISALSNPDAPLGHHFQDATHIVFGVGTLGVRYKWARLEGSVFTGREPDENRFDFDRPRWDSYSYRLSIAPGPAWSLQFSQGFIKSPEVTEPDEDVTRTTASAIFSQDLGGVGLNSSLVWGMNNAGGHHKEHSVLWENNFDLNGNMLYTRYEWVQKFAEELGLEEELGDDRLPLQALTAGYSHRLLTAWKTNLYLGGQLTMNIIPERLQFAYGERPLSAEVYLRITPGRMR